MLGNIPEEMKAFNQWIVWKLETLEDGRTTKIPYCPQTGYLASVTNPTHWCSFDYACAMMARGGYSGIGFVLTENDPYVFIDLDNPYGTDAEGNLKYPNADEIMSRQIEMHDSFDSYIERSPSRNGLHIIVKGSVPSGRKRDSLEVYSTARYMTMTGDVIKARPIAEYHDWANSLWAFLAPSKPVETIANYESQPETISDNDICETAYKAQNGEKFLDLYSGRWNQHYTSQSDADFALFNILAFYTDSKTQVHRIFMASALGQRPKAKRPDYIRAMLDRSFDRKIPLIDFSGLKLQFEKQFQNKPVEKIITSPKNPYNFPPGLVGEIADFIYAQAAYPSKEIALAGSLALMSGICGRAYNVSGTGVNNYIVLLAKTGRGKEAMAKGISRLLIEVKKLVPTALDYKGPNEFASPQGLNKQLLQTPCFISIFGEFGLMLEQLNSKKAAPNIAGLRRMFLDLYNKSGKGQILDGIVYSDRDKNVKSITAPAFSFLGECTPEKYYSLLDDGISTEGFLPRLTTIEFLGDRCLQNEGHYLVEPRPLLIQTLANLVSNSDLSANTGEIRNVIFSEKATKIFKEYDEHCGRQVNKKDVHLVHNEMWTRANVKAMKLAAIIAIGIKPWDPIICEDCANWAINVINYDNGNVIAKFENGETGTNNCESDQLKLIKKICSKYATCKYEDILKAKVIEKMHSSKIITYKYVQSLTCNAVCFKNDKIGANNSLKKVIQTMLDSGLLQEMQAAQARTNYNYAGKCYAIVVEL